MKKITIEIESTEDNKDEIRMRLENVNHFEVLGILKVASKKILFETMTEKEKKHSNFTPRKPINYAIKGGE